MMEYTKIIRHCSFLSYDYPETFLVIVWEWFLYIYIYIYIYIVFYDFLISCSAKYK
jgi:hypothetical protein